MFKKKFLEAFMSNENQELLAAFTVLDVGYQNAALRYIPGAAAGDALDISPAAIENPATAVGVPSLAVGADDDPDPVLFTFTVPGQTTGSGPELRVLLVKVSTPTAGGTSTGRYSVLDPHNPPSGTWETVARDVYLQYGVDEKGNPVNAAGNPHAVAQAGDTLYIIEYDTQKIWSLGIDDLDGLITTPSAVATYTLDAPIDLGPGTTAALPSTAKGQDLIYLTDGEDEYLFALYQVPDSGAATGYTDSVLVRLKKNTSGAFEYDDKANVGLNAQSIIPVTGSGGVSLLVPAIGGMQNAGSTNEEESNIYKVAPFAASFNTAAAVVLTGDPMPSSGMPTAYDIAAIAAQAAGNGVVYILTYTFAAGWSALNWKLYKTTANQLLAVTGTPTLSSLVGTALTVAAQGPTQGVQGYGGLSYWDILYENGTAAAADRLWFRKDGILVNDAQGYGASPRVFAPGLALGQTGGVNINSFNLAAETIRQAKAGVSLKRGFKSVKARAAEEEEEEKK
jgi:hypothetical protein